MPEMNLPKFTSLEKFLNTPEKVEKPQEFNELFDEFLKKVFDGIFTRGLTSLESTLHEAMSEASEWQIQSDAWEKQEATKKRKPVKKKIKVVKKKAKRRK